MTCPSCGTIAASGAERCARCGGLVAAPADAPTWTVPVPRAPTHRGVLEQARTGVVTTVLVPPPAAVAAPVEVASREHPWAPEQPPPPAPAPPVTAPVAPTATATPSAVAGPVGAWAPGPPATRIPAQPAPPPASPAWNAGPAPVEPTTRWSAPPVPAAGEPTATYPAVEDPTQTDRPAARREDDERTRAARAGLDAAWPPPPGRWTGRQPSES